MIQYSVRANFVLFVTNWLRNSGKMKGYLYNIWTVRIWTMKFPGDTWIVEILIVKSGLRLRLGLGLVMAVQFMTVQVLTVQIKIGNQGTAAPNFGQCLLSSNGWMGQDAIWYGRTCRPRPHCVRWEPNSPT